MTEGELLCSRDSLQIRGLEEVPGKTALVASAFQALQLCSNELSSNMKKCPIQKMGKSGWMPDELKASKAKAMPKSLVRKELEYVLHEIMIILMEDEDESRRDKTMRKEES